MTANKKNIYLRCFYIIPGTNQYQQLVHYVAAVETVLCLVRISCYI
jgi:hypothetical protein